MSIRRSIGFVVGIGFVAGTVVTVGLLCFKQSDLAFDNVALNKAPKIHDDYVRQVEDKPVEPKKPEMDPDPQVEVPPLDPLQSVPDSPVDQSVPDDRALESKGSVLDDVNTWTWTPDEEYWPIYTPDAEWPTNASELRLEGVLIVQYDVTKEGTVENSVVLEAEPPGIFDRAALSTISKFKYKPKILNGEPVRVTGVKNRIIYELNE